jgi:hypothetical protein
MRSRCVPIDPDLLERLYVAEGLTADQIASRISCGVITILRRLRRLGVPIRQRGPRLTAPRSPVSWSPDLAWAVGVLATDGNLSRDGRHLSIPSKDADLLESLRRCLTLQNSISRRVINSHQIYRLQWGDRQFYKWLLSIGLTPAKSLTLGPLAVPDEHFVHFFRGCIDGDGSIRTYVDHYNTFKKPTYIYTRLFVSIVSASPRFPEWLRATVRRLAGLSGSLTVKRSASRNDIWCLKYAKRESLALLRWMYQDPLAPCLRRKREIAEQFLVSRTRPQRHGPGRPVVV